MNRLLLIASFLWLCTSANAQIDWLTPGARWYYDFSSFLGSGLTVIEVTDGDTLLGNTTYKRLLSTTYYETYDPNGIDLDTLQEILLAKQANGVVIGYEPNLFPLVLYDFTKTEGDTLHGMLSGGTDQSPFIIDSVGIIDINGLSLPFQDIRFTDAFDTSAYTYMRVVQGIGSIQSHFFHSRLIIQPFDAPFYYPLCYEDPNVGILHLTPNAVDCDYFLDLVATTPIRKLTTHIYPNPVTDIINIGHSNDVSLIIVSDFLGHSILQTNATGELTSLDISFAPGGIYIVTGYDNTGEIKIAERILVQE
jgi:hypothetical protein